MDQSDPKKAEGMVFVDKLWLIPEMQEDKEEILSTPYQEEEAEEAKAAEEQKNEPKQFRNMKLEKLHVDWSKPEN